MKVHTAYYLRYAKATCQMLKAMCTVMYTFRQILVKITILIIVNITILLSLKLSRWAQS